MSPPQLEQERRLCSSLAIFHYRRAALLEHPDGMYNPGRYVEYGKVTERDLIRAAKSYQLAAEKQNAAAGSRFGICRGWGIGAHNPLLLPAQCNLRAAEHGLWDGANNFRFCLE
jgi:TPR repeat protein